MSGPAGWAGNKNFETNFVTCEAKELDEWRYMTEFLRL